MQKALAHPTIPIAAPRRATAGLRIGCLHIAGLRIACGLVLASPLSWASIASADELVLKGGGIVRGTWLNASEESPESYRFKTAAGIRVSFRSDQVRKARVLAIKISEYERRVPQTADQPEAQWKLAEWCREKGLAARRRVHLERIIEFSPDHVLARRALGYSQVDGEWVTQASFFRERGYELHGGRWLSPQEILVEKRNEAAKREEMSWYVRLKRARKRLAEGPNQEAMQTFLSIREPAAIYGLKRLWQNEASAMARRVYASALVRIASPVAVSVLVEIALNDPDLDVFQECMTRLKRTQSPEVVDAFVKALHSPNNAQVNRAAAALGELRDLSTIDALISALVTTHVRVIGMRSANQVTSTFIQGPGGGGGGMKVGNDRRVIREVIRNEGVLSALAGITGQSFGFNQQAWSSYWDSRRKSATVGRLQQDR